MKYLAVTFLTIFIATSIYAEEQIEQVGYMKDENRNRIFTLTFNKNISETDIQKHAANLPNTAGWMTAAYYYPENSVVPSNIVTSAGNIVKVIRVLYETPGFSKWKYAYMITFSGKTKFINCTKTPENVLCRKE